MRQSILFVAVIRNVVVLANVVCLAVERLATSFKPQMRRYRYAYVCAAAAPTAARSAMASSPWRLDDQGDCWHGRLLANSSARPLAVSPSRGHHRPS